MIASAHMQVVTTRVAGVERVIACAPPRGEGIWPGTLVAMDICGVDEIPFRHSAATYMLQRGTNPPLVGTGSRALQLGDDPARVSAPDA